VEFRLFGPLQVRDDAGGMCQVSQGRLRTLLAALLVHAGAVVSTDALTEYVWGEAVPGRPRVALQVMVTRLRGSLGPQGAARIRTVRPGYLCEVRPGELDVARFEELHRAGSAALVARDWASAEDSLAEALGLWRGQPLADVPTGAALDRYTAQLECTRLHARRQLVEAGLHLGRHTELLDDISVLAQEHPLDEELRAQWMLALYRSGRQSEALDVYQQTHRTLAQEIGVDPAPPLRELHQRILNADPTLTAVTAAGTSAAARELLVPSQLPASTRTFTGRTRELEQLLELARRAPAGSDAEMVVISAIDGMGGVGKSALAIHAAHRVRGLFPDGQLFVDLLGHTPGLAPLTAGDAVNRILRTLGVSAQNIPADLDQRIALYRQRLADSRTLIVLDNAVSTAQVRPLLLSAPGCLLMVTSRRRLTGLDDAATISLDMLTPAEAGALLCRVAGPHRVPEDSPAVGELLALCGHLPLAIRIAAARLRHHRTLTVRNLVEQLRDEQNRLDHLADEDRNLTAVFDTSYAALPEPEQILFHRLSLVPGTDFDVHVAANLLATDQRTAERLLESLLDHHLLAQHGPGRYQFHDLVRLYARTAADTGPLGAQQREAALERLLDYYQHTAQHADRLLNRYIRPNAFADTEPPALPYHLRDRGSALTWMRAERDNLLAAVSASTRERPGRAIALTAAMSGFLHLDGSWAQAATLHEAAAAAAHKAGDPRREAAALCELGRMRHAIGEYPASIAAHKQALAIFEELGDRHGEAEALWDLGRSEYVTGNYTASADLLERGLAQFHEVDDRQGEAGALNDLGRVRLLTGDYPASADLQERALVIYQELEDQQGVATVLRDLGRARFSNGDPTAAIDLMEHSLKAYREVGNRLGEASSLHDLGHVHNETGNPVAAVDMYQQALTMFQSLGNRQGEGNTLWNMGRTRQAGGEYPVAVALYERARTIYQAIGNKQGEAATLRDNGRALHLAGDGASAAVLYQQARTIYQAIGNRPGETAVLTHMGALASETTGPREAQAFYQEALALARQGHSPLDEARALEGIAHCAAALGQRTGALEDMRQAVVLYQRTGAPEATPAAAQLAEWESSSEPPLPRGSVPLRH